MRTLLVLLVWVFVSATISPCETPKENELLIKEAKAALRKSQFFNDFPARGPMRINVVRIADSEVHFEIEYQRGVRLAEVKYDKTKSLWKKEAKDKEWLLTK